MSHRADFAGFPRETRGQRSFLDPNSHFQYPLIPASCPSAKLVRIQIRLHHWRVTLEIEMLNVKVRE